MFSSWKDIVEILVAELSKRLLSKGICSRGWLSRNFKSRLDDKSGVGSAEVVGIPWREVGDLWEVQSTKWRRVRRNRELLASWVRNGCDELEVKGKKQWDQTGHDCAEQTGNGTNTLSLCGVQWGGGIRPRQPSRKKHTQEKQSTKWLVNWRSTNPYPLFYLEQYNVIVEPSTNQFSGTTNGIHIPAKGEIHQMRG